MNTAPRIASPHPALINSFVSRFHQLDRHGDVLKQPEVRNFIGTAIGFLKREGGVNQHHAENIAHYLMGKADASRLPIELRGVPWGTIPAELLEEVSQTLHEVLRTHRFGFFGLREAPQKTLMKLEFLHENTSSYETELAAWVTAAPEAQSEARRQAFQELMRHGNSPVTLTGLTQLPPLRMTTSRLVLKNNHFESLEGLPRFMPWLETLNIDANRNLVALSGFPDAPNLQRLSICHHPALTTLRGMAASLASLEDLNLQGNALTSTSGLPELTHTLRRLDLSFNPLREFSELNEVPDFYNGCINLRGNADMRPGVAFPWELLRHPVSLHLDEQSISRECLETGAIGTIRARLLFCPSMPDGSAPIDPADDAVRMWRALEAPIMHPLNSQLDASRVQDRSLLQELARWHVSPVGWDAYAGRTEARWLSTLLSRLHGCASFISEDQAASRKDLASILDRMLKDEVFRNYCFEACQAADEDCEDNVQAIFDELRMEVVNPARQENATLKDVIRFQRGKLACTLIDRYVTSLGAAKEGLESGQELKRVLCEALDLPIQFKTLRYASVGVVSHDLELHKSRAVQFVNDRLTHELGKFMADDPSCIDFLKRAFPVPFAAVNILFGETLDELSSKEGAFSEVADAMQMPTTLEEALAQARHLPCLGDGRRLQALQELAHRFIVEKVLETPDLTVEVAQAWSLDQLLASPAWLSHLQKSPCADMAPREGSLHLLQQAGIPLS